MTDDLIAFIRARLDDDERVVRADPGYSQEWHTEVPRNDPHDESRACVRSSQGDVITGDVDVERARHIAHYDPARMLREVEAKRKVIDQHGRVESPDGWACRRCSDMAFTGGSARWSQFVPTPCMTVRLLALPYTDHDDYEEDWRP